MPLDLLSLVEEENGTDLNSLIDNGGTDLSSLLNQEPLNPEQADDIIAPIEAPVAPPEEPTELQIPISYLGDQSIDTDITPQLPQPRNRVDSMVIEANAVTEKKRTERLSKVSEILDQAFLQPLNTINAGIMSSISDLLSAMDVYAKKASDATGGGGYEGALKYLSDQAKSAEKYYDDRGIPAGAGFLSDLSKGIYRGAGSLAADLPLIMGSPAGLPALMGLKGGANAEQNDKSMLLGIATGVLEGVLLKGVLKGASLLPASAGIPAGGAIFAMPELVTELQKSEEDRDYSNVFAQAFLGSILTIGGKKPTYKEVYDGLKHEFSKKGMEVPESIPTPESIQKPKAPEKSESLERGIELKERVLKENTYKPPRTSNRDKELGLEKPQEILQPETNVPTTELPFKAAESEVHPNFKAKEVEMQKELRDIDKVSAKIEERIIEGNDPALFEASQAELAEIAALRSDIVTEINNLPRRSKMQVRDTGGADIRDVDLSTKQESTGESVGVKQGIVEPQKALPTDPIERQSLHVTRISSKLNKLSTELESAKGKTKKEVEAKIVTEYKNLEEALGAEYSFIEDPVSAGVGPKETTAKTAAVEKASPKIEAKKSKTKESKPKVESKKAKTARATKAKTEAKAKEVEEIESIGLTHAAIDERIADMNEVAIEKLRLKSDKAILREVKKEGNIEYYDKIAEDIAIRGDWSAVPADRVPAVQAAFGLRIERLRRERAEISRRNVEARKIGDEPAIHDAERAEVVQNTLLNLEMALGHTGSLSGKGLEILQKVIRGGVFSEENIRRRALDNKNKKLTDEETVELKGLTDEYDRLTGVIEKLEESNAPKKEIMDAKVGRLKYGRFIQKTVKDYRLKTPKGLVKAVASELWNLPVTAMFTADISGGRQGGLLRNRNLKTYKKAWVEALKQTVNKRSFDEWEVYLNESKEIKDFQNKYGLEVTKTSEFANGEEMFNSEWLKNTKLFKVGEIVQGSERNMSTLLNMLRIEHFRAFLKNNPGVSLESKKEMAKLFNVATGRGETKALGKILTNSMAAPKFAISRFQAVTKGAKAFANPELRAEAGKIYGSYFATRTSLLALFGLLGYETTLDPSDSDFGKIVINNHHYDIWNGLQQPARLAGRMLQMSAGFVATNTDHQKFAEKYLNVNKDGKTKTNPKDIVNQWHDFRLQPWYTAFMAAMTGKNAIHQKIENPAVEIPLALITPLTFAQMRETAEYGLDTPISIAQLGFDAIFESAGGSVSVYEKAEPPVKGKLRKLGDTKLKKLTK